MALPQVQPKFDAAAYLEWEAGQQGRHEFVAGEVFAMVGVRQAHNIATGNLYTALRRELRSGPCRVFIESVKTRVEAADCFFYPDVVVTGDPRDRATPDYVSHPSRVVEVLSESTAAFDRGDKFAAYRRLESLREYGLLDLKAARLELFRRDAEGHWVLYEFQRGERARFAAVAVEVEVDELLEDTEEPPAAASGASE